MAFLEMVLAFGGIIVQFATNILGTLYVTASTAANRIAPFVLLPLFSIGSALSVFTAQNYGAKKYSRIVTAARQITLCGYAWNGMVTLIMFLGGGFLLKLVASTATNQVINLGWTYLKIYAVMSFVLTPLVMQKDVLQPLGRTFWSMVSGFTEILGRAASSLALLAIFTNPDIQFLGVCFSDPIAWLIGLLTVVLDYHITIKRLKATPDGKEINLRYR
jgi:Na+-driven multidrug efflux pump